ncbi:MAG: transcriptional regulator, partial [Pseudomonadota bacterium]|nr:transcriptional regulator [Pseudomonadota bacterium]
LIAGQKQGKEVLYSTTERGRALIERYTEIREACLVDAFSALGEVDAESLADLARRLRALSGLYGQAARSATNL